jgi:SAM-dependent methyltransferase
MQENQEDLTRMYERRFAGKAESRRRVWEALCVGWFNKFIPADGSVLDMAAGRCEFINAVRAREKTAVDLNRRTSEFAAPGVKVIAGSATMIAEIGDGSQDVVFASNLLEHLSRPEIVAVIREARRVLKRSGLFLILQPNIRFLPRDYWMFFDHITPIDDRALCEALELGGFHIERCIPRFLPYTTRSRLPMSPWLVRLYLRLPVFWRFFGKQAFVVASLTSDL